MHAKTTTVLVEGKRTRSGRLSRQTLIRGNVMQQTEEDALRSCEFTEADEAGWTFGLPTTAPSSSPDTARDRI